MNETPLEMYLQDKITSGKFAELIGVKRHIGDEIISVAWDLKQQLKVNQCELTAANQRIAELESELAECYAMLADSMCWCRDNPAKYQSGRCMRAVQSKIREYDSLVKFLSVSSDICSAATQQHSQPKQ